jgi:hypothetical protein
MTDTTNATPLSVISYPTSPYPTGSNNIYSAGLVARQNQIEQQSALTKSGGRRHSRRKTYYRKTYRHCKTCRCRKTSRRKTSHRKTSHRNRNLRNTRKYKTYGGAASVPAPVIPSYAPNYATTASTTADISALSMKNSMSSSLDKTTTPEEVAAITQANQAVYSGK